MSLLGKQRVLICVSRQVLFFTVILACSCVGAAEYSRELDFPPVRLTLDKAAELANDLFRYVQSVNGTEKETKGQVEFKSLKYDASFDLPLTPEDLKESPDRTFSFTVRLRSQNNKINNVVLSLQDRTRSLTVSGHSHDHITGLISIVNDRLEQHYTIFGGLKFRILLSVVIFIIFFSGYGFITWRFENIKVLAMAALMLILLPNTILWLFPWERIFPGTLLTRQEIGLLDNYAPLFTFLSLLLSIAMIIWQVVVWRAKRPQRVL